MACVSRRELVTSGVAVLLLSSIPAPASARFAVQLSDALWRRRLRPDAYTVLRHAGTEQPGSSRLNSEKRRGSYFCAGCGHPMFQSSAKFESGTGWPSFFSALPGSIVTRQDGSGFGSRTEVLCARCGGHLGHVFTDGPKPTGLRYCINGVALAFRPA